MSSKRDSNREGMRYNCDNICVQCLQNKVKH